MRRVYNERDRWATYVREQQEREERLAACVRARADAQGWVWRWLLNLAETTRRSTMEAFKVEQADGSWIEIAPETAKHWRWRGYAPGPRTDGRSGALDAVAVLEKIPLAVEPEFGVWVARLLPDAGELPRELWEAMQSWCMGDLTGYRDALDVASKRGAWAALARETRDALSRRRADRERAAVIAS